MSLSAIDMAERIAFLQTLGIELVDSGETFAIMQVTVDDRHLNYLGGAHGGLLATLADTVSFFPECLIPAGRKVTTANLNLTFIRGGHLGDRLEARADILHLGRRMVSLSVSVHNSERRLLAHGSTTLIVMDADGTERGSPC